MKIQKINIPIAGALSIVSFFIGISLLKKRKISSGKKGGSIS